MVANLLSAMGVPFGDRLMPPGKDNPKGFFEDIDFVDLNDRLLQHSGCKWSSPEFPSERDQWSVPKLQEEAGRLLDKRLTDNAGVFGLKDPRMCRLLPFWRYPLLMLNVKVRCVIVIRHPFAIASSLMKRDGFELQRSLKLWYDHMMEASTQMHPAWDRLVVDYDALFSYPRLEVTRIGRFIGAYSPNQYMPEFSDFQNLIDPMLRHVEFNKAPERLSEPYKTLWTALFKGAHLESSIEEPQFNA